MTPYERSRRTKRTFRLTMVHLAKPEGFFAPAMSVVGGHGPEGMWPFANVMRPAPQGALPDCFRRDNVSRRLPFVNKISKDRTYLRRKRKFLLTNRFGSAILIGGRAVNLSGRRENAPFCHILIADLSERNRHCRATGGEEVVKLRSWESLKRPRRTYIVVFPNFVTSELPSFLLCEWPAASGASGSAERPGR